MIALFQFLTAKELQSRSLSFRKIFREVHGRGIDAAHLEKIFERFERLVNPNEISGLGLGLYLSRKIIEAHGGKIWAESRVGEGSTFYIQLPVS